jgi:hypothetical protein
MQQGYNNEIGFNMNSYILESYGRAYDKIDSCNTVACIAGWQCVVELGIPGTRALDKYSDHRGGPVANGIFNYAMDSLGLTDEQAKGLFLPNQEKYLYGEMQADDAVKVLRHLAETGSIDPWDIIGERIVYKQPTWEDDPALVLDSIEEK